MNLQISFSTDEIKDNLSTPKFPKGKSISSLEKEENTLDTIRQQIDKVNNDKDNLNLIINLDNNFNESKNDKNILSNSLINKNINLDLNNLYMSQFSFDEKSSNFLSKKENNENIQIDNTNNNMILINEDIKEKKEDKDEEKKDGNINENYIEENNNNEIKYINNINNDDVDKNEDSNFDYELPLGSDNAPEFFNVVSFPENNEKIKDENNQNEIEPKKANKHFHNMTNVDKELETIYFNKNEEMNLTPRKKVKIRLRRKMNSAQFNEDEYKCLKIKSDNNKDYIPKFNSSNQKINKMLKFSSLIDDSILNSHSKEKENRNYTSKDINNNQEMDKNNKNGKIPIKHFMAGKLEKEENIKNSGDVNIEKNKNNNIIKKITLSYNNRRKKRYSCNFSERNNNYLEIEPDQTKIIYEKNLSKEEPKSFSITKNETLNHNHQHSRNYKELNNNLKNGINTYSNQIISKKVKNSVILFSKNKNILYQKLNRNNSFKNPSLSTFENFSPRSLEINIERRTERSSPFRKSKINDSFILKNSSQKKYILDKKLEMNANKTITYFSKEIKNEKYRVKPIDQKNNIYIDFKNKGYLTQRNKDIGPINIYSKKIIFIPNGNNNNVYKLKQYITNIDNFSNKNKNLKKEDKINNFTNINNSRHNKIIENSVINKSYIIPKEKNIKIFKNEINNNLDKIKSTKNFDEYFNEIQSNIHNNKITMNERINLNNNKKQKEQKEKHKIRKIIQLSKIDMNKLKTKTIQSFERGNNKFQSKCILNKMNKINNKIKKNNYVNNNQIIDKENDYDKPNFIQSQKSLIEKYRKNILHYSIIRNNQNNQVKNEVSIFIGDNEKNRKNIDIKKNRINSKTDNQTRNLWNNKKTIINVNQYYSSYYIKK